jgi:Tfp pilus assembly protein PilE
LRTATDIRRRFAASEGVTLVELLIALFILVAGILSTFTVFTSAKHSTSVSEIRSAEIHQAQNELERLQSLSYSTLALTSTPATAASSGNPGFYVGSGTCPTYQWNQSAGATNATSLLVINSCPYWVFEEGGLKEKAVAGGEVKPTSEWKDGRLSGTVYDYVTWVNDKYCNAGSGCPGSNGEGIDSYKRITVAVTSNSTSGSSAPTGYVLASAIVSDPHARAVKAIEDPNNPLNSTKIECSNAAGEKVTCNFGLGGQTPHSWWLTNWPWPETAKQLEEYRPVKENNACMHYTEALRPSSWPSTCTGTVEEKYCSTSTSNYTGCPRPDFLSKTEPKEEAGVNAEGYDLSSNLFSVNAAAEAKGRVLKSDTTSCSEEPAKRFESSTAEKGELWATEPLKESFKLSGNGGMTLLIRTLSEQAEDATLCLAVYVEKPVSVTSGTQTLSLLDPLNLTSLGSTAGSPHQVKLGAIAVAMSQLPGTLTPISFTFNYMASAKEVAEGASLGVRLWTTAASPQVVINYDAFKAPSKVQLDSE